MKRIYFLFLLPLLFSFAPQPADWKAQAANPDFIHRAIKEVTDVMVHDIYSPPVASRIYAYTTIAGYEAARHEDASCLSLAGQLHDFTPVPEPEAGKECNWP